MIQKVVARKIFNYSKIEIMRNLKEINIKLSSHLTNEQLLALRGGAEDLSCYHCECVGSTGGWYARREDLDAAEDDGVDNCASGEADCEWTMMSMCIA